MPSGGCRPCKKAYYQADAEGIKRRNAKYRKRHPERIKASKAASRERNPFQAMEGNIKHLYGITVGQWNAMLIAQAGRCWLCERPMFEVPVVEHSHETKAVRGLAHGSCNRAFGHAHEDPEVLQALLLRALELQRLRLHVASGS
jgi:hypothetical protein